MSVKSLVKQVLTEKENRSYHRLLADRKVTYGAWLAEREKEWAGAPASEAAAVTFVLVCAGQGKPAPYAEKNIAKYFAENPAVQAVYGDEDVLTEAGEYKAPWFKPDWSPDLLDSCLYFGSLVAVRRQRWQEMKESYQCVYPGRWQQLFGEENEEKIYRVTDLDAYEKWLHDCVGGGYEKGSRIVGHLPQILFHAHAEEERVRFLKESSYLRARRRGLLISFFENFVDSENACKPVVTVVIPSKDHPDILRQCVESVRLSGVDIPLEIIVIDNGSKPENKAKIERMLREEADAELNGIKNSIRYRYSPMEFNFSRLCNLGAAEAGGELLLFLNDDVVLEEGCIRELAARAARTYTGAVGLKLLYPDSARIQHAGITNLPMGPVHKLQFQTDDKPYYGKANHSCRNFIAVTAACLMVEKEKFREAGGFSEELRVAFNDVDFCFRLHELGYYNVCLNDLYAYHHESLSRGTDEAPEKLARLLRERDKLYARHPGLEGEDPYYSVHLNRDGLDTLIRPAYETAGNKMQKVKVPFKRLLTDDCRQDECLLVRVEDCRERRLIGYSVVLGDNNACYEKMLLLKRAPEAGAAEGAGDERNAHVPEEAQTIYGALLQGQYRPDLEENLPDQTNVALSGFDVELGAEAVSTGRYRIGMLARNRVNGLKLINWSNRYVEL